MKMVEVSLWNNHNAHPNKGPLTPAADAKLKDRPPLLLGHMHDNNVGDPVFTMTPPGDEPIRMRLTEIKPGESFTHEMDAGDFVVCVATVFFDFGAPALPPRSRGIGSGPAPRPLASS